MTPTAWLNPALHGLECPACDAEVGLEPLQPTCPRCGKPVVARYDLGWVSRVVARDDLARFGPGLWRYGAVLPFAPDFPVHRLGEGGTPLLPMAGMARELGVRELCLKDESGNATQSF